MEEIKSKFIIKLIFSFLRRNSFLTIISYSKQFQSKLNITLNDYKFATNYHLIQENDITKIFLKDSNILVFQGKFEKGKKIEGKEYKMGKKYFIGKYKNNSKYEGKTLNKAGNTIFKGIYNNGLFWDGDFFHPKNFEKTGKLDMGKGSIIEYNFEGNLQFVGEYKDGMKFSGKEYNKFGKKIFEGLYKNNLRWNGKFFSPNQSKFTEIKEGNGNIKEYNTKEVLVFKGELKNGFRYCGRGKEFYEENGNIKLDVEYNDFNYIKGIYYNIKGSKEFEGKFKENKKYEGILYQEKDGLNYSLFYGEFNKEKKSKGIEITGVSAFIGEFDEEENYLKGKYYQGDFDIEEKKELFIEDNLKELNIEEIEKKGIFKFEGEFKNQLFYKGKEYKYNQITFEGEYKDGFYYNGKSFQIKDIYTNKLEGFDGIYINGSKQGKEIILDGEGNTLIEKTFKDEKNWNYTVYGLNEIIIYDGEIIDGNCEYVVDYKIYIDDDKNKKVYKYFEGSYKNNEKYIGKEYYNNGNIKFEGEFKEGKYSFGKEYYKNCLGQYKNNIKFEGEYKNGKYYKGKEYHEIYKYYDEDEKSMIHKKKKFLKFEGIYKEGKKYIGWEFNINGNLIFSGEYKSGLYWHGYFYEPYINYDNNLKYQEKSGFVRNGCGKDIRLYNERSNLEFIDEFIDGKKILKDFQKYKDKYIEIINDESFLIKDLDRNETYEKEIDIKTNINGFCYKIKLIKEYIINKRFVLVKQFEGVFKKGKVYNGEEYMFYKKDKNDSDSYKLRTKRTYHKGKIS